MAKAEQSTKSCYRPSDVAKLLDVAPGTILRWVREGRLPPPLRPGPRTVRWPVEVIHAAIDAMRQTAAQQ